MSLLLLAACRTEGVLVTPDPGWERMLTQPRVDWDERSADLPEGVVTFDPTPADPTFATGLLPGGSPATYPAGFVDRVPFDVTLATLARGRDRYAAFCSPCHGGDGRARTKVADFMPLRPRVLVGPEVRDLPDGAVYFTIREGYGAMPSYGSRLPPADAWAVVAWVRALEAAAETPLDALPPDLRDAALRELP